MSNTCPQCTGTGVAGRIPGIPVPVICTGCHGTGRIEEETEPVAAGHYEPASGFIL
jgi:DnaJ-class molecular chaperone